MGALTFTDESDLAEELRHRFGGSGVVAIDGWTGTGKTTLARFLAMRLGGSAFDVDSALQANQKCYVPALRLDEVSKVLSNESGLLFVSGICLREVLDKLAHRADAHIYIKRMAKWGWADEDELEGGALQGIRGSTGGDVMRQELRRYHTRWQPHLRADLEFHWHG